MHIQIYNKDYTETTDNTANIEAGETPTIKCINGLNDVTVVLTCPGGHMSRGQSVTSLRDVHVTREWDGGMCICEMDEVQENVYLVQSTVQFTVYCK